MSDVVDFDPKRRRKAKPLRTGLPGGGPASGVQAAWETGLLRTKQGEAKKVVANVVLVLSNAPEWKGAIAWDAFAERILIMRDCPAGPAGGWGDVSDINTAVWLQRSSWRIDATPDLVAGAVRALAAENTIHPLRDKLNAIVWDGKARLDTWLSVYLRAADHEVHREIGKRWMLGAVARAFDPGCQMDLVLILEGLSQGEGKSSTLRILSLGFFTDDLDDVGSKDAAMQLHGAWIVELPELDAMGRAEVSRVKAFTTRRTDRYRAPYGRHVAEHARGNVFAGTVNHNDWHRDESGGRRYPAVEVGETIDRVGLARDVEQLWGEAVARYRSGEHTYTIDARLRALIAAHTAERYQEDPWHAYLMRFAEVRESVSVSECLLYVGIERGRWSQGDQNRVAKILKHEGYRRRQVGFAGRKEWRYVKPVAATGGGSGSSSTPQNPSSITTAPVYTSYNDDHKGRYRDTPQGVLDYAPETGGGGSVVPERGAP